ncbi:MAG: 2-amino-4-hydroxy-6-hydroxymethyldihydropteridine diphosphokinase [Trueperaceae bacterium]
MKPCEVAERAVVAMGSNLGDPIRNLRSAREELCRLGRVEVASSIYRTAPVGGPHGQDDYLNAVVLLAPKPEYSDPRALLGALLDIEQRHGRVRRVRWEARMLDLDLLTFDNAIIDEPGLVLPHPRMMERGFVLAPLCEAWPQWRHPITEQRACEALKYVADSGVAPTSLTWGTG